MILADGSPVVSRRERQPQTATVLRGMSVGLEEVPAPVLGGDGDAAVIERAGPVVLHGAG